MRDVVVLGQVRDVAFESEGVGGFVGHGNANANERGMYVVQEKILTGQTIGLEEAEGEGREREWG